MKLKPEEGAKEEKMGREEIVMQYSGVLAQERYVFTMNRPEDVRVILRDKDGNEIELFRGEKFSIEDFKLNLSHIR